MWRGNILLGRRLLVGSEGFWGMGEMGGGIGIGMGLGLSLSVEFG